MVRLILGKKSVTIDYLILYNFSLEWVKWQARDVYSHPVGDMQTLICIGSRFLGGTLYNYLSLSFIFS